jgi:phage gp16-like protein
VTTTAPHKAARPARNGDLAAIHIAKAQLQLDDDEYRDLMATVCNGIRSAADLDWTGRRRFLAHLQACLKHRQAPGPARHIKAPLTPAQRLMWSLWMRLADAGQVGDRTMKALEAFAKRQTSVERLQWLNKHQEDLVIASLKTWLKQRGPQ